MIVRATRRVRQIVVFCSLVGLCQPQLSVDGCTGKRRAVTTQKGLIHPEHARRMSSLPRVSLNGEFQHPRYVKVMLSGAPFAIWRLAQRISPLPQTVSPR